MYKNDQPENDPNQPHRRRALKAALGAAVAGAGALANRGRATAQEGDQKVIRNGRIKQSIVQWCFAEHWSVEQTVKIARQLGCGSVELIDPTYFPLLKSNGLECAIASLDMNPDPPFAKGWNNPKYRSKVLKATTDAIDACARHGFRRVIAFTGMSEGLSEKEGARNCVEGLRQIIGHAEKNDVTICLEMLNTRDDSHPMKGHPGYQGNHTDYCVDIIRCVGSDHLKLLFDVYHVQVMDGDVIRRIRQLGDLIGHVHTAGNPGRGELDDTQEIAYKPIMEALVEIGYQGYVGQEFLPTRDPLDGLKQAVAVCDV